MAGVYKMVLGGDFTALPVPGDPIRVIFEHDAEGSEVRPGIAHFAFRPIKPDLPDSGQLPKSFSVHCLPKTEAFPDLPDDIERLQRAYGLEPGPVVDKVAGFVPSVRVGVNTTALTAATGQAVDAHWRAVITYEAA